MLLSFKQIAQIEQLYPTESILNANAVLAHLRKNGDTETLVEHTELVMKYCYNLIDSNGLEPVIDSMIERYVSANINHGDTSDLVSTFIKSAFIKSIYFHDFGKVNENFQVQKMGNRLFTTRENGIGSDHSVLSAYIFISHLLSQIDTLPISGEGKMLLYIVTVLFAHTILKHHGRISNPFDFAKSDRLIDLLPDYFNSFRVRHIDDTDKLRNFISYLGDLREALTSSLNEQFAIYALTKLNSSLLSAADYYATNEFMIGMRVESFGQLDTDIKRKLINKIGNVSYNKDAIDNLDAYKNLSFNDLVSISEENLNKLRQKLVCEVLENLRHATGKRLFYIEAPTGSGKTNLSLIVLRELLSAKSDVSKVFYVFPYITLITQTLQTFRESLGLTASEVAEIHSKGSFCLNEDDSGYGTNRRNYIDSLFVNYPISLISHVRFFDIFVSTEKEASYLLHRLANSVVIVDEVHSYSPAEWDKLYYLIKNYSEQFNITFVLMSATLPKIGKILIDGHTQDEFVYLVSNRNEYFLNPNFKHRVKFVFDYLKDWEFSFDNLAQIVHESSEEYFLSNGGVKAVVEFVTKKSAHRFFEEVVGNRLFDGYEKLIITGTVLEPRRREIIDRLKAEPIGKTKSLVVATQVIEAGVDIDMDIGFKDKSIIDSEEQVAGRINRNAKKKASKLYLFNSGESKYPYRSDLRYKQKIPLPEYMRFLEDKNFDDFYQKVLNNINLDNQDIYLAGNLSDFAEQIRSVNFEGAKRLFKLIESSSVAVFVPLIIPPSAFTVHEIRFLTSFDPKCFVSNGIDGRCVWNIYSGIIESRYADFLQRQIDLRTISSIISKFCFNIWNNPSEVNKLRHYGEIQYGFLYLYNFEDIYSYEEGLVADIETDTIL